MGNASKSKKKKKPVDAGSSWPTRMAGRVTTAAVMIMVMWLGAAAALDVAEETALGRLVLSKYPVGVAAPTVDQWGSVGVFLVGVWLFAGLAAWAALARANARLEDEWLFEQLAKAARLGVNDRGLMRVHARRGRRAERVTLRVAADEPTQGRLREAFAVAWGVPTVDVTVGRVPGGVMLGRRRSDEPEAPADSGPAVEPVASPVVSERLADRVVEAMRGALENDGVTAAVTETHRDRTPKEVWVMYPPRATAGVVERIPKVVSTMTRSFPPKCDEWSVQLHSDQDRLRLLDRVDPLAPEVAPAPLEDLIDLYEGPVIGVFESGGPWRLPLMAGQHVLVAGATRSGKGSIIWSVIRALAPMAAQGLVRFWIIDPKGGMELGALEGHVHRFAVSDEDTIELLVDAHAEMKAKAARARAKLGRKVEVVSREFPLDLVVVDEMAALAGDKEYQRLSSAIMREGGAPAFGFMACTQDPRQKTIANRQAYTAAVCLRVNESSDVNMILGQGMRANGAFADMIPDRLKGVAFVVRDDSPAPARVRAAFVDDAEIQQIVRVLDGARLAPPTPGTVPVSEPQALPAGDIPGEVFQPNVTPVAEPQDAPEAPAEPAGELVRIGKVSRLDLPVRLRFDGDPDVCQVVGIEDDPDDEERLLVRYLYPGDVTSKVTSADVGELVRVFG